MKFAKELERDLVPEWRLKYLDYKIGKKKLKAINRALRTINQTPRFGRRGTNAFTPSPFESAPKYSFLNRDLGGRGASNVREPGDLRALAINNSQASLRGTHKNPEEEPLNGGQSEPFPGLTRYGSILGSPPNREGGFNGKARAPPSLRLPGAALDPETAPQQTNLLNKSNAVPLTSSPSGGNAYEVGKTISPPSSATLPSRYKSVFSPKRVNSNPVIPVTEARRPLLKRVFTMSQKTPPSTPGDVPLEAYRELDVRQAEFFFFLDAELEKIETFYKQKEDEATKRMAVLREQLHFLRDRRLDELISRQTAKMKAKQSKRSTASGGDYMGMSHHNSEDEEARPKTNGHTLNLSWLNPIDSALEAVQAGKYGKTTKAMHELATPSALDTQAHTDNNRDYTRRRDLPDVPYQSAKRKLKDALQEYYRGLELLKSYALLNRTAFRKINKKYDKTVNARPSMRYMAEKVNKTWFVQSDVVEGHIRAVEDLYARYFEKGNHKVAVGKLRVKMARAGDYTETSFRNGLTLAAGAIFGIQGLVQGIELLYSEDAKLAVDTSYLLQVSVSWLHPTIANFCVDICRILSCKLAIFTILRSMSGLA
ncbi:SPX domain-containing protein [Massariosphaeria phaeospora]|uniref:SPX domain-containing protein n=1 Tax=Massariosphaeria phaeospora TaxID=100035 RepID=A0A7C8I8X1_9PLEO|nr:SPX domain-containing protein [Massariosphaeria phaeospora]